MMPAIIGSISRPLRVGEAPLTICRYSGMKMIDPNIARPRMKPAPSWPARTSAARNSRSGRIGSAARVSWQRRRARPAPRRPRTAPMIVPEPQAYSLPPQLSASSSAAHAGHQQAGAEPVDRVLPPLERDQPHHVVADDDRDDRQRHVDVEDPAPVGLGEVAADQRAGDRRDAEHRAEQALVAAALPGRDHVRDDRERQRHQTAGAEALDAPGDDQLGHVLRQAGQQRADQERADREQEAPAGGRTGRRSCRRAGSTRSTRAGTR